MSRYPHSISLNEKDQARTMSIQKAIKPKPKIVDIYRRGIEIFEKEINCELKK